MILKTMNLDAGINQISSLGREGDTDSEVEFGWRYCEEEDTPADYKSTL